MLDQRKPGWWRKVDLDELDLAYGNTCVLGQVYKSFERGKRKLDLGDNPWVARRYGFYAFFRWDALTAEWRKVISARCLAETQAVQAHAYDVVAAANEVLKELVTI